MDKPASGAVVGDDRRFAWGQYMIHMNKCTLCVENSTEYVDMRLEGGCMRMDMEVGWSEPTQRQMQVVVQELKWSKMWDLEQVAAMKALRWMMTQEAGQRRSWAYSNLVCLAAEVPLEVENPVLKVMFRREVSGSPWLRQQLSMALLEAFPLKVSEVPFANQQWQH